MQYSGYRTFKRIKNDIILRMGLRGYGWYSRQWLGGCVQSRSACSDALSFNREISETLVNALLLLAPSVYRFELGANHGNRFERKITSGFCLQFYRPDKGTPAPRYLREVAQGVSKRNQSCWVFAIFIEMSLRFVILKFRFIILKLCLYYIETTLLLSSDLVLLKQCSYYFGDSNNRNFPPWIKMILYYYVQWKYFKLNQFTTSAKRFFIPAGFQVKCYQKAFWAPDSG